MIRRKTEFFGNKSEKKRKISVFLPNPTELVVFSLEWSLPYSSDRKILKNREIEKTKSESEEAARSRR